jgi:hypothetical protein
MFKTKNPIATAPKAETPAPTLADCKTYQEALDRAAAVDGKLTAGRRELENLRTRAARERNLDAMARGALAGEVEPAPLGADVVAAQDRVKVLERAQQLAQTEVQRAENQAARAIAESRLPEHRRLAADIGAALKQLKDALDAEAAFRDDMDRAGVGLRAPLLPAVFTIHGDPSILPAAIQRWRAEMGGYISR